VSGPAVGLVARHEDCRPGWQVCRLRSIATTLSGARHRRSPAAAVELVSPASGWSTRGNTAVAAVFVTLTSNVYGPRRAVSLRAARTSG